MDVESRHRAAVLFSILILLIGGLGLLSAGLSHAQSQEIQGVVTEEGNPTNFLIGVEVTLLDAHGQKDPEIVFTDGAGTFGFTPDPGFYYITVRKSGFFDNETETFRFDGTSNLVKPWQEIEMEKMPDPSPAPALTVQVKDSEGDPIPNATVELFNVTNEQVLTEKLTNVTGNATFALWTGSFEVRIQKVDFEKVVLPVFVTMSLDIEVTLNSSIRLVGLAKDLDGIFVREGLVAYMYNTDAGTPDAKKLLVATITGSSYTFDAYVGNFTLIVDADGKAANISELRNVTSSQRIDRNLTDSPEERVDTDIRYIQGDWNNLTLRRNLTLNEDSTLPGLAFAFIRNLRLQLDLARGDGDGILQETEIDDFRQWLLRSGPKHVDTQGFFTTDSRYYRSALLNGETDYTVAVDIPGQGGFAWINTTTRYTREGDSIPLNRDKYFVNVTTGHDTNDTVRVNYTYNVRVVPGYERVATQTTGMVEVTRYIAVDIDPLVAPGDFTARMEVERSLNGTARVMVFGPLGRFTELNVSVENYTVIVPVDVNITLSAEESTDPNSPDGVNPDSTFNWTFTHTSKSITVNRTGITPEVFFNVSGNYNGTLKIIETGRNTTYRNFTVHVDGILPVAVLENNVTGLGTNANNTNFTIKEGSKVKFFGGNSTDEVHENMTGKVRDWKWDLDGDGEVDATGKTVVWSFQDVGNFTINLTVVDQAGHESANATMWVIAEDITPPAVEFEILDEEFEEAISIVEDSSYYFDASGTTDNFDSINEMDFDWAFGDGSTATGSNVTHVYVDYGNYEVTLNVTDTAGNLGNATRQIVVQVEATSRPDLEIETNSLSIEPRNPEESTLFGQVLVTIRLNVTNKEDRTAAKNVQVTFWAFRFGESPGEPILIDPTFLTENGGPTNDTLDPGEKKIVEFTWTTPAQGNYTLRVNVTDLEEPDLFVGPNNSAQTQIDVRQAGWKTPLTIAAIVGVIAGIPTAIYLRRRFRGRLKERITKKLTKK